MPGKTWDRLEKHDAAMFEARDADTRHPVRLRMSALIRARRQHTYEIDAASRKPRLEWARGTLIALVHDHSAPSEPVQHLGTESRAPARRVLSPPPG